MLPFSMATAPSSMFGPAMVSTVPCAMTMSTAFDAARMGRAERRTAAISANFFMIGTLLHERFALEVARLNVKFLPLASLASGVNIEEDNPWIDKDNPRIVFLDVNRVH